MQFKFSYIEFRNGKTNKRSFRSPNPCLVTMVHNLTHWGRVTHICVGKLIISSDNGLSPGRRKAIIWTNAGIWLMGPLGTNFSEISIEIHAYSFTKMHLKMSSAKWSLFCFGLIVITAANNPRCTLLQHKRNDNLIIVTAVRYNLRLWCLHG